MKLLISFLLTLLGVELIGLGLILPLGGTLQAALYYFPVKFLLPTMLTLVTGTVFGGLAKEYNYWLALGVGLFGSLFAFVIVYRGYISW